MASEDSRYRDRCLRFIVSVIRAISIRPSRVKYLSSLIIEITALKDSKSLHLAVLSGCSSKNGMISPHRSDLRFTAYRIPHQAVAVVVTPVVADDRAATEELHEFLECVSRWRCLGHRKLVLDLPAESEPGVTHHRNRKATFAVDKADDPLLETWPFLLIDRTGRIVTAHVMTYKEDVTRTSTAGYTVFPAYSQLLIVMSPPRRAELFALKSRLP